MFKNLGSAFVMLDVALNANSLIKFLFSEDVEIMIVSQYIERYSPVSPALEDRIV